MEPVEVQPVAEPEAKDEWPFPEFALEEIDPPILPWRKRKPFEPRGVARTPDDEWLFPEFALEEIDPPILPWRKRKPVEPWRPAPSDANDAR